MNTVESQLNSVCDCYDKQKNSENKASSCSHTSEYNPQNLSNLIWSLAKLGVKSEAQISSLSNIIAFRMENQIASLKARDISNTMWAFATIGIYPKRIITLLAKAGRKNLSSFNSQELLKFLWSVEKCGVIDKKLEKAVSGQQKLSYQFPFLPNPQGSKGSSIVLSAQAPGRKLQGTGVAAWEASFVLAEWLSRHRSPADVEQISEMLLLDEKQAQKEILRTSKAEDAECNDDGFPGTPLPGSSEDWSSWRGKKVVEIGAGLGLPSIISSRLGMRTVTTDGDDDVILLLKQNVEHNTVEEKSGEQKKESKLVDAQVKKLLWGLPDPMAEIEIHSFPDVIMAADVVYGKPNSKKPLIFSGNDTGVWKALVDTIVKLATPKTLVLISQVKLRLESRCLCF